MQQLLESDVVRERRHYEPEQSVLWAKLTLAQSFSVKNLTQYGYNLAFLRNDNISSMAVLLYNGNVATVSSDGDVDTKPSITYRN